MKKLLFLMALAAIVILTVTSPAQAQDAAANMAQVIIVEPITGHAGAFEEGAKTHQEWSGEQGATWTWAAFEIVMGERTGQYFFFSGGHTYADFDDPDVDPAANAESIDRNIVPHVENVRVQLIRLRADLSMLVADAPPRPFYEVFTFRLNPGGGPAFEHYVGKIKAAVEGAGVPFEYSVFESAQGGNPDEWVVSIPHATFASMTPPGDLTALLAQQFGQFEADGLNDMLNGAVASSSSEIFALRPDLSLNLGN